MANILPAPPAIDDRAFEDLVAELLARVPAHTPEWRPQEGDPGRTLIELFAWLSDTVLYRANLIPEKQRLAFLDLLGKPLTPAQPARGLVNLSNTNPAITSAQVIARQSLVPGPVQFETTEAINLLPITGESYYKRGLSEKEKTDLADVLTELQDFHDIDLQDMAGYVTEQAFEFEAPSSQPLNLAQQSIDGSLWIALMAETPAAIEAVKATLAGEASGEAQYLNVGFDPGTEIAETLDDVIVGGQVGFDVSISTGELDANGQPVYLPLDVLEGQEKISSTVGLTQRGIFRVKLPANAAYIGVPEGDVRTDSNAGVGMRPPRLDDPEKIARTLAWLKIDFEQGLTSFPINYIGINCTLIEDRTTISNQVVGQSSGSADQVIPLPWKNTRNNSLAVQVHETGRGYVRWYQVEDLALVGRDDRAFVLNSALGTIQFGNGVFGRIPPAGNRIRIASAIAGGGSKGNLPAGTLTSIQAQALDGSQISQPLALQQVVNSSGGVDAETLAEAERRLPSWLKHRNRAVVETDYKQLATEAPGAEVARVEVLPKFLPLQRRENVPGIVSVMVLPEKSLVEPANPRPDKPLIEKVYNYLEARKPIATELYVIGCEYVPIALSVAITVRNGFGREAVLYNVKQALKNYLWSLAPHGPFGDGWPLGRAVGDRELEVVAARVEGVKEVGGCNIFTRNQNNTWLAMPRAKACNPIELSLEAWQLPELLGVVVTVGDSPLNELVGLFGSPSAGDSNTIAIPVIPEVC